MYKSPNLEDGLIVTLAAAKPIGSTFWRLPRLSLERTGTHVAAPAARCHRRLLLTHT